MVSARENPHIDDVKRLQPIYVRAVPPCFQDSKTFKISRFDCILCDFFDECKKSACSDSTAL
ncbi:MAG: hypothetical protein HWN66_14725 [Candidatus Helarchaeota archaeon]|nr:hypothetical protein [Candidatus Helarchaeota archaeon]